jgi:ATP-dependent exoDNAse (exonuclease V) beta subunit
MSNIKIYKASAGSGKTYTLALEYIRELLTAPAGDTYRHILAVTFTKDATGEMKDRILAELYGLAFDTEDSATFRASLRDALREAGHSLPDIQIRTRAAQALYAILHDYSRLNITTIDSFFQKVLRNLARELGQGSKFNLEMNVGKVLQEAVRDTIEKAAQNKQVLAWLTTYVEHKMEDERNWRVDRDLFAFSHCIYNEFFQENEQTLRRQLADNPRIFSELNQRQHALQNQCRQTFRHIHHQADTLLAAHALTLDDFGNSKYGLLFLAKLGNGDTSAAPGVYVEKCRADAAFWGKARHPRKAEIEALAATDLLPLLTEALDTLPRYRTSRMITANLHQLGLLWDIVKEVDARNADNNRFMLSDTARFLHDMIDASDAPFIYEKIGAEIRHVMIDEFQDTSRLQWENFHALLSNIIADDAFSLIVGDVKQSIYRWRNGDWRILNTVADQLHARSKTLEYNYRSERQIVAFNNDFFLSAAAMLDVMYQLKFERDDSPFLSTYSVDDVRQQTGKTTDAGYVSAHFLSDEDEDDRPYADRMAEALFLQLQRLYEQGIPPSDLCILTRTNREIIQLADYLASLNDAYPDMAGRHYLRIVSDEAFQLKSSQALRILIDALRTLADPANALAAAALHEWSTAHDLAPERDALQKMPLFELVGHLYRRLRLEQIDGQSAYLFTFYDCLAQYLNDRPSDLAAFLRYWDEELKYKPVSTGVGIAGVRAMTIHRSKGLQFPTVLLPFCDWSLHPKPNATIVWCGPKENWYDVALLPVAYSAAMADTPFADEYREETCQSWMDNLNLMYVAFTRAERNLILLSKYKNKLRDEEQASTVAHLLQLTVPELPGHWDETAHRFEVGALSRAPRPDDEDRPSANPLKQTPPPMTVAFASNVFPAGRFLFRQSNQSREFVSDTPSPALYGNIMHHLFEQIADFDSIEPAVDHLIDNGLLRPADRLSCIDRVRAAIRESHVEHWFDGRYRAYREHTIITEENDDIVHKRPDRVLFSDRETIVVDYKFGAPHASHQKQVRHYMRLLESMQVPHVQGFVWYVEQRSVEAVRSNI